MTVGTTLPFDDLVRAVDALAGKGAITEPVVCQIGPGAYEPRHCEYFRFKPNVDEYIEQAALVIGHGGTGTVTGLLAARKPFVAVANPLGAGNHQAEFLDRLSRRVAFLWTADLAQLPELIAKAAGFEPAAHGGERLTDDLRRYLADALGESPAPALRSTKK